MVHLGRRKGVVVGVANIARGTGRQMRCRLAESCRPIVAACASAGHDALVRIAGGLPGHSGVAGIAGLCSGNMRRRLGLRVDGDISPAVASSAITGSHRAAGAAMVHQPRREGDETAMAGIALGRCRNVVGRFAEGIGTVMATGAATGDWRGRRGMVEGCRRPGGGGAVAGIALGGGRDMGWRFHLGVLCNVCAAVASGTVACRDRRIRAGMAHDARREGDEAVHVTDIALRTGRDVGRRLAQRIDGSVGSAVAGGALAGQPGVIHPRRLECSVIGMAGIALNAGGNVHCRLAEHGYAVVAGRAVAGCRGAVGVGSAGPGGR